MSNNALNISAVVMCAVLFWLTAGNGPSPDPYATWLAGEMFAAGNLAAVYPAPEAVFTMRPPEAWIAVEAARAGPDQLYPFLYPPIWAAWAGELGGVVDFDRLLPLATAINAALLSGMIVLAWRAVRAEMALWLWIAIAAAAMLTTHVGYTALQQNQPQIAVSFLIVLAIERSRANANGAAGAALALAAAIKVYPALFALLWLAARNYRALASFTVCGGALAALSVFLAGWPLHLAFLGQLATISDSVLMTPINYNLAGLAAQFSDPSGFQFVQSAGDSATGAARSGWHVTGKGAVWALLSKLALVAALAALMAAFARADTATRHIWLWPCAIGVIALLSPLTWAYHYLPVFAFLPVLIWNLAPRHALIALGALLLPIQIEVIPHYLYATFTHNAPLFVGSIAMIALTLAFGWGAFRAAPAPRTA